MDAKVISDYRGADGILTMQLTKEMQLTVGSGRNSDRLIDYEATIKRNPENPESKPIYVELFPNVELNWSK